MLDSKEQVREVGYVTRAKSYVFFVEGLPSARINDIIVDEEGNRALVQAFSDTNLVALALDPVQVRAGTRFGLSQHPYQLSVGEHLFGRVINALGEAIDRGKAFPPGNVPFQFDADAPGIDKRVPVKEQLYTGCTLVDTLLPVAKGQRQLIFGGDRAGKTSFLIDVVRHQSQEDHISIYVLIGKSQSELRRVASAIFDSTNSTKTIVVAALSGQLPPRIAIAPAIAYTIAEHFQRQGKDVLIILDDLDAHAKYLREIALMEERLPGRESYPGDLFYQQAHLMERSGTFVESAGGGSITTFPVVATDIESFSSIIPTNLMSCTDGHLLFLPELQGEGVYPAISIERSVTRMGRQAQTLTQRQLSSQVRLLLGRYRQQRDYAEFSVNLKEEARAALRLGEVLEAVIRQEPSQTIPVDVQVPLVALTLTSLMKSRDVNFFLKNKNALRDAIQEHVGLQELRAHAKEGLPLEAYLALVEAKREIFENVCRE